MSLRARLSFDYLEPRDNPSVPGGDPIGIGGTPPAAPPPPPPPDGGTGITVIGGYVGTPTPPPPADGSPIVGGSTAPYTNP